MNKKENSWRALFLSLVLGIFGFRHFAKFCGNADGHAIGFSFKETGRPSESIRRQLWLLPLSSKRFTMEKAGLGQVVIVQEEDKNCPLPPPPAKRGSEGIEKEKERKKRMAISSKKMKLDPFLAVWQKTDPRQRFFRLFDYSQLSFSRQFHARPGKNN